MADGGHQKSSNFWKSPIAIVCYIGVGYWIYTYHWEHALGLLPYAIILLCPLMHIFMHGSHGGGHGGCHHDHSKGDKEKEDSNGSR